MSSPPASSRSRLTPIVLSQAFGFACGIAGVKLNSQWVPPALLGSYGVFLTFAPIGMWVVHAGLTKFILRHWAASPQRGPLLHDTVRAWARRLPWLAGATGLGALLMARQSPVNGFAVWAILFVSAALLAFAALAQAALQAERAHWRDFAVAVSTALSRTFAPLLLFVAMSGAGLALWLGFGLHALVVAIAAIWTMHAYWHTAPAASPTSAATPITPVYEGPMFIALALSTWTLSGLNRWLVSLFFGPVETGYFTLAGNGAIIAPTVIGVVLMQYFQPGFFLQGDGPAEKRAILPRDVDRVALLYTVVALGAVAAVTAISPYLVGPLISPNYRDALHWILPAGCFGTATMIGVFYHSLLLAGRREVACGPVDLTTAGILVLGCVVTALAGPKWFSRWLIVTPLVPWLLTRTLARRYFFMPAARPAPTPGP